ncbi:MAG: YkgJ family cysteine cluster protein [Candidatus Thiothrix sulfatifontis]|nr:MAG: YkgJ family cysteine cluster protein [Candidatus Thiothrix sulfatifontis]
MTQNYQIIRFLRRNIPAFACEPGCHDCCGPVTASSEEIAELPVKSEAEHAEALADWRCPYLGEQGCTVYAERPLICRVFGTTLRLACPRGRKPDALLAPTVEQQVWQFLRETRQVLL